MRAQWKLTSYLHLPFAPNKFFMQKILLIAATALSISAAALGYLNYGKLADAKTAAEKYESELAAKTKECSKVSADLKVATDKLSMSGSDSEQTGAEVTDLRAQVAKLTSGLADVQKQSADKDATLAQQKSDIEAKDAHMAELEAKVNGTSGAGGAPSEEIKKQMEEKNILVASLNAKIKEMGTQLSALKEREDQRRKQTMRSGLEGRILAVNSAWGFVVISLGDRNGVVNNAEMLIKRGTQLVGKVRITSVEPSTSVADIVANSVRSGFSVQPGDTVIYGGPGEDPLVRNP